ncbi:MAG: hypothetical protein ACFB0E_15465 [Leptolyngbyaceae cyanobacterium]
MSHFLRDEESFSSLNLQNPNSIVNFAAIYFLDNTYQSPIISANLERRCLSTSLLDSLDYSLVVENSTTEFGQRLLSRSADVLIKCQVQAFMKPLSSIYQQKLWESLASTVLSNEQTEYRIKFQPTRINQGFYSLQLLLVTSGVQSLPLLFEIPIIQVKTQHGLSES